ncbi:MAG: carbohydrate ABC transporter permease [Candidatus Methylomirabilales bacterium]
MSRPRARASRALGVLVGLLAALWLLPPLGLLVASLRPAAANAAAGWWTALAAPGQLTFQAYAQLAGDAGFLGAALNTVLIAVPATAGLAAVAALAAYGLAWVPVRGREALFLAILALLVVPLQMALIPVAGLYERLGLFGRIPGLVAFHIAFGLPFAVFLLRNAFAGVPAELLEAARLDGAGDLRVLRHVVLPLAAPTLASLLIFQFLWVWNDLLVALVFASPASAPLTVFLREQLRQFGANIDVLAPGAFLQMLVPLLVFLAFRRRFTEGLLAGSLR